jgi:hypothetical protein
MFPNAQRLRLEATKEFQEASNEITDAIRMLQGRRSSRSTVERAACVTKKFRVATVRIEQVGLEESWCIASVS